MTARLRAKSTPCVENTSAVVLALSAFNPGHWIVPLLLAEMKPEQAFKIIRLCSGLTFPLGTVRDSGVLAELTDAIGPAEAAVVGALGDEQILDFPPFTEVHKMIQTARCFTFAKVMGTKAAAERLGLSRDIVHARRAFVYRKLRGG